MTIHINPMKKQFFADSMVGKLTKWLRICGLDVLYSNKINTDILVKMAREEERTIITRNTKILEKVTDIPVIFIKHDRLPDQLKQFFQERKDLNPYENMLTRCLECGSLLEEVEKEKIVDKLYPFVYKTQDSFRKCPSCDKIYWGGTHKRNMEVRLRELLK